LFFKNKIASGKIKQKIVRIAPQKIAAKNAFGKNKLPSVSVYNIKLSKKLRVKRFAATFPEHGKTNLYHKKPDVGSKKMNACLKGNFFLKNIFSTRKKNVNPAKNGKAKLRCKIAARKKMPDKMAKNISFFSVLIVPKNIAEYRNSIKSGSDHKKTCTRSHETDIESDIPHKLRSQNVLKRRKEAKKIRLKERQEVSIFSERIADKLPLKNESKKGKSGGHSQNKLPSGFKNSAFSLKVFAAKR
jgi:hypothetical protein